VHPSSSSLETDDNFTKAEPFRILHEDTEDLSTSSAPEGDVISLVNDKMVKTVEVPDKGTFEPCLVTDSNLAAVVLPEHANVLCLRTTNECNLTSDVERELKKLLLDHSDTFAKDPTDLGFCDILKHDTDTGDSRPIKQSTRRPALAAKDAEDEPSLI